MTQSGYLGGSRILGIDPGSRVTGWGLLAGSAARPRLLEAGVLRLGRGDLARRLGLLQERLGELVPRLHPTVAAVESPFHGASARSALQLAHARGVILAVLAGAGVEIAEYTPATVKKAVTGSGRADKGQVASMVARLLGGTPPPSSHDLTDALALALCHLASAAHHAAVARAGNS
jgi:crossover junction endodeoxyribonuclease RuvC